MARATNAAHYVNGNEEMGEVLEVWESYSGSLWFIVEEGDYPLGYARLAQCPQFAEWGSINRPELEANPMVWTVDRENWQNVNTYEDGLLVRA